MRGKVVHCKREPYDRYIGRGNDPRTGSPSIWGNPFSRKEGTKAVRRVRTVAEAIWHLIQYVMANEELRGRVGELYGSTLGCWCYGDCHGHALLALAEEVKKGGVVLRSYPIRSEVEVVSTTPFHSRKWKLEARLINKGSELWYLSFGEPFVYALNYDFTERIKESDADFCIDARGSNFGVESKVVIPADTMKSIVDHAFVLWDFFVNSGAPLPLSGFWSGCNYNVNSGKNKFEPLGTAQSMIDCDGCPHIERCTVKREAPIWEHNEEIERELSQLHMVFRSSEEFLRQESQWSAHQSQATLKAYYDESDSLEECTICPTPAFEYVDKKPYCRVCALAVQGDEIGKQLFGDYRQMAVDRDDARKAKQAAGKELQWAYVRELTADELDRFDEYVNRQVTEHGDHICDAETYASIHLCTEIMGKDKELLFNIKGGCLYRSADYRDDAVIVQSAAGASNVRSVDTNSPLFTQYHGYSLIVNRVSPDEAKRFDLFLRENTDWGKGVEYTLYFAGAQQAYMRITTSLDITWFADVVPALVAFWGDGRILHEAVCGSGLRRGLPLPREAVTAEEYTAPPRPPQPPPLVARTSSTPAAIVGPVLPPKSTGDGHRAPTTGVPVLPPRPR